MIIATAGHVDHGKTTLVRALTGVETDRLEEERRRGLTIEPGFAYMDVDGARWGFVDVPGHHRFVGNMLSGVAGVDAALLVIAADDGPMPQTHEHLSILSLLGVRQVVVAVSKSDLVSPERLASADSEIRDALAASSYADAPRIPVSGTTGTGLDDLLAALTAVAGVEGRVNSGTGFRFAIDRAFSVHGAGVVVTGFVHSGAIRTGDDCLLLPAATPVRVRSVRVHDQPAESGQAGDRMALNITGAGLDEIERGGWLTARSTGADAGASAVSQRFDARLRCLPGVTLKSGDEVHVHHGARRTLGRITLLDGSAAMPRVHISTREPLAVLHGDRFVVRDAAAQHTLAGGRVLDNAPPRRGRTRPQRLAVLDALEAEDLGAIAAALLTHHALALDAERFAGLLNIDVDALAALLPGAIRDSHDGRQMLRDATAWEGLQAAIVDALRRFHAGHPQLAGMGPDELRAVLDPRPRIDVLDAALAAALRSNRIERSATRYRLPEHAAALDPADRARWARIEPHLSAPATRPPVVHDLARELDAAPSELEALLARVHHTGGVVRISDNRFMLPTGVARLAQAAEQTAQASDDGMFEARAFKDSAGIGRNLAIDVLEFFDRQGLTRRRGNARLIVGSAVDLFGSPPTDDDRREPSS